MPTVRSARGPDTSGNSGTVRPSASVATQVSAQLSQAALAADSAAIDDRDAAPTASSPKLSNRERNGDAVGMRSFIGSRHGYRRQPGMKLFGKEKASGRGAFLSLLPMLSANRSGVTRFGMAMEGF